jgi:hypothetical protein
MRKTTRERHDDCSHRDGTSASDALLKAEGRKARTRLDLIYSRKFCFVKNPSCAYRDAIL